MNDARHNGVTGSSLETLERAKELGVTIHSLTERHRQREAGLSALVDTARDLANPQHDLDSLLKVIARRARLLLATDMAYIGMPDDDHQFIHIRASDGHTTALNLGLRIPGAGGLGRAVLTNPSPMWTPDYLSDERISHAPAIDDVVRAERLHAIMAVPLTRGTEPFGSLYVADRSVRHFTADEVSLLSSLGDLASVAIERAQLLGRTTALVAELERHTSQVEAGLRDVRELSETHNRLIQFVLDDCDLETLALEASKELKAGLRVCAANGTVLTTVGVVPPGEESALVLATMDAHAAREPVPLDGGLWAMPIAAGAGNLGTLLVSPEHGWTAEDDRLLRLVAQVVAVQLLIESSRTAIAEGQVRDDFLSDLLNGPQRPPQLLDQHARRLGLDLSRPHVVVIARPEGDARGKPAVWASSYAHRLSGLKSMHNGCAVLLLPGTDPGAAARAVCEELTRLLDTPVTVGSAGPVSGPASVQHTFREAVRCLDAMTALGVIGRSASVRELGFLGVLLSDSHDVEGFVDSAIGPVIDYDQQRFTDLTRTLETYFDAGGSPTNAAKKLHVHPNTVARRLERISELLGPEWQQPERALEVQLALRVFRVRHSLRWRETPADEETHDPPQHQDT
ncbi:helix-turn-helix domain-containing protein [Streptomyces sp. NPDC049577]|uniref:helix-turn-helix domain-containing protein n=1 Tax=Streptomyces sp. NPDC049577 TaxID=3155153 RepID=UPI00343ADC15